MFLQPQSDHNSKPPTQFTGDQRYYMYIYIYIEREGLERRKNTTENYNDLLTHPPRQPALLLWIVHTIDIHKYVILLYKL